MTRGRKTVGDQAQDLWGLLRDYARQETIDPLRTLGRYLGFGLAGASLMTLGVLMLALSALRAMQTETGDLFVGWRSSLPYLVVVMGLVAVAALAASRIPRDAARVDTGERADELPGRHPR